MDFYDRVGVAALGSRLRRLGDRLAEEATGIYRLYDNESPPRSFPVLYLLGERGEESITAIADAIGHSHPSVSQIVREMARNGLVELSKSQEDSRKTVVALTEKGRTMLGRLRVQCMDVKTAAEALLDDAGADLWSAVAACETALQKATLLDRVKQAREIRVAAPSPKPQSSSGAETVNIVDFRPEHAKAFKELNEAWIRQYFEIEPEDSRILDDPLGQVIAPGGHIVMAELSGQFVGCCGLLPHGPGCMELIKMAVSPAAQGRGIGKLLGRAAVDHARQIGLRRLYLESNRRLKPALAVYRSLGFVEVTDAASPYKRADIQMELLLETGAEE